MLEAWLKFAGICGIVMAIVLFCVVFGGYSSFHRSQNRVEASAGLLAQACEKRQTVLKGFNDFKDGLTQPEAVDELIQTGRDAQAVFIRLPKDKSSFDPDTRQRIETGQEIISEGINTLLTQMVQSETYKTNKEFEALKKRLIAAQDNLFVTWKRHKKEVDYYNTRTSVFPGFLIARLFGFDDVVYQGLSPGGFLPARKAFSPEIMLEKTGKDTVN